MSDTVVLINAKIVDGTGKEPFIGTVLIQGKHIQQVGLANSVDVPKDAKVFDLSGSYLLPGLIDAHLHLTGLRTGDTVKESLLTPYEVFVARVVKDLEALLNAGFTTIGDAGGAIAVSIKKAVEEGTIAGPRISAAGYTLSQTFGHGDEHYLPIDYVDPRQSKFKTSLGSLICDGVEECQKAARYALRCGADFIKVSATGGVLSERDRPEYTQFTLDELKAIVQEAEHAKKFVHAHAQGTEGIKNSLQAGVKVIAHAIYIDEECCELAKEKNAIVVPTLSIVEHIMMHGREIGIPEWGLKKCEQVYRAHIQNIKLAYRSGVKLATGTDFLGGTKAFRHGDNALEIVLLVERIGMTPMEAIVAATKNAAEAVGLSGITGTIEQGKLADLIVVKENPLENIRVLAEKEKIAMVFKEGKLVRG
ncbi:MAG TPA: amidohydrolase family protein [Pseudothermotoga sp.]|nr:amidohydrolase family protein [Pseudothermotoga sp.]HOK84392.1 amidohydrolase family protein [Pseudothermotoga sp.]HPP70578.1 amidohydrolase family protein [Pseudothermotoga sp.]